MHHGAPDVDAGCPHRRGNNQNKQRGPADLDIPINARGSARHFGTIVRRNTTTLPAISSSPSPSPSTSPVASSSST
eukprot:4023424-Lingulodinium_polyedra.AAC.1